MIKKLDTFFHGKPGRLGQIKFDYGIFSIVILIGIIFVFLYFLFPTYREEWKFIAAIIGGLAALYTGYYVAATLRFTYVQERIQRSFEFNQKMQTVDYSKIRIAIHKVIDRNELTDEQKFEEIEKNEDIKSAVVSMLNTFENISIAITYGYVSEELIYRAFAWIMPHYFYKLKAYVDVSRKRDDKRIWKDVERLVDHWKEGEFLLDNKPIPDYLLQ
jgi:uncharacterized membrane protein YjgN (DUF898 family)